MMRENEALKSTAWLADHLQEPKLRIFDCTSYLLPDPETVFRIQSARKDWASRHIPGANHIDLQDDISDSSSGLRFTMPTPVVFANTMAKLGVNKDSLVVLYSTSHYMWASRVWWMLKSIGFENAYILDGGLQKWLSEGRAIENTETPYPAGKLSVGDTRKLFADKYDILSVIKNRSSILINALPPGQYKGDPKETNHGRLGHIPTSINIPANSLLNPSDGTLRHQKELQEIFSSSGLDKNSDLICYCGGGVSATCIAMALHLSGFSSVRVYDGSLNEWALDASLPMVCES